MNYTCPKLLPLPVCDWSAFTTEKVLVEWSLLLINGLHCSVTSKPIEWVSFHGLCDAYNHESSDSILPQLGYISILATRSCWQPEHKDIFLVGLFFHKLDIVSTALLHSNYLTCCINTQIESSYVWEVNLQLGNFNFCIPKIININICVIWCIY